MSDPVATQAGYVDPSVELAARHLHPDPVPSQPAPPATVHEALERLAVAFNALYAQRH